MTVVEYLGIVQKRLITKLVVSVQILLRTTFHQELDESLHKIKVATLRTKAFPQQLNRMRLVVSALAYELSELDK
jgi:hypothetical protein